jgi:hypothetical protein
MLITLTAIQWKNQEIKPARGELHRTRSSRPQENPNALRCLRNSFSTLQQCSIAAPLGRATEKLISPAFGLVPIPHTELHIFFFHFFFVVLACTTRWRVSLELSRRFHCQHGFSLCYLLQLFCTGLCGRCMHALCIHWQVVPLHIFCIIHCGSFAVMARSSIDFTKKRACLPCAVIEQSSFHYTDVHAPVPFLEHEMR